jgi:hypothetical protein
VTSLDCANESDPMPHATLIWMDPAELLHSIAADCRSPTLASERVVIAPIVQTHASSEAFVLALATTPELFTEAAQEAVRLAFIERLGMHGAAARLGVSYHTAYARICTAGRAITRARQVA